MAITFEPRTSDVRALAVSIALGSGIGLAIGGAYLAGGFARNALLHQSTEAAIGATSGIDTQSGVPAPVAIDGMKSQAVSLPVGPTSLRDRFHLSLAVSRSVDASDRLSAALAEPEVRARETHCLAQAVYYEARSESASGQAAVAQVVLNRVRHPAFPKSICGVVFQRAGVECQFSFVCDGAMRKSIDNEAWSRAMAVANRALNGAVVAGVGGATHFHAARITTTWASSLAKVAQIGEHIFYRFARRNVNAPSLHADPGAAPASLAAGQGRESPAANAPVTPPIQLAEASPTKTPQPTAAAPTAPTAKTADPAAKPPQVEVVKTQEQAPAKTTATTAS